MHERAKGLANQILLSVRIVASLIFAAPSFVSELHLLVRIVHHTKYGPHSNQC